MKNNIRELSGKGKAKFTVISSHIMAIKKNKERCIERLS